MTPDARIWLFLRGYNFFRADMDQIHATGFRGARIQLSDPAVITRVDAKGALPGDSITVQLVAADVSHRQVKFERVG